MADYQDEFGCCCDRDRFARHQAEYAARGIATFPFLSNVEDKRPMTRGYHRVGLPGSLQLALKFPDAPGIACMAGRRSMLTLVDIDARGPEADRLLGDVQNQYGPPKVVVRTGKTGIHCYYRHNGEGREIRPDPSVKIDVLGAGVIVLPPSRGLICDYQFIEGTTIDDLTSLTVMRGVIAPSMAPPDKPVSGGFHLADLSDTKVGERDKAIYPYIARLAQGACHPEALFCEAMDLNNMLQKPLSEREIRAKCQYWWGRTERGENRFGIGQHVVVDRAMIDGLMVRNLDAYAVLSMIMRHHWNRDFVFANAMREIMSEGGWTLRRFVAARNALINEGIVTVVRDATRHDPMLCRLSPKALRKKITGA